MSRVAGPSTRAVRFAQDDSLNFWEGAKEASKKQSERRDIDRSSTRWTWKSGYSVEVYGTRAVEGGTGFRNRAREKT